MPYNLGQLQEQFHARKRLQIGPDKLEQMTFNFFKYHPNFAEELISWRNGGRRRFDSCVYVHCIIISMNSSCFMKLCWPNLFEEHRSNYSGRFDGRFTSERRLFERKSLGKTTVWAILSQSLFSSENRAANRRHKQMTGRNCDVNKYLITMIILWSSEIFLNPGPSHNPGSIKDLQDLTRSRGVKILHRNICGLPTNKASLEEPLSHQGCEQAHIIGISETHLNKHILDGETEMEGFLTQGKDRHSGGIVVYARRRNRWNRNRNRRNRLSKGGGMVVYVTETLTSHRRFDLEANDIECIWIEVLFNKSKPLLV